MGSSDFRSRDLIPLPPNKQTIHSFAVYETHTHHVGHFHVKRRAFCCRFSKTVNGLGLVGLYNLKLLFIYNERRAVFGLTYP